jgi:hypothetical protein
MKMEHSAPKRRYIKIQTPGNYPEESIQAVQTLTTMIFDPSNNTGNKRDTNVSIRRQISNLIFIFTFHTVEQNSVEEHSF